MKGLSVVSLWFCLERSNQLKGCSHITDPTESHQPLPPPTSPTSSHLHVRNYSCLEECKLPARKCTKLTVSCQYVLELEGLFTRTVDLTVVVSGTFDLFDVMCKQHRTALNLFLNGTNKPAFILQRKRRSFRPVALFPICVYTTATVSATKIKEKNRFRFRVAPI